MKNLTPFLPTFPAKAAAIIAFSFVGLTAFAASPQGSAPLGRPPVAGLHASPIAPSPAGEDIFDIRGPIHIPAPFPWAAWASAALAAAGLGISAWTLIRRPRRKLPYEIALEKLAATRPLMLGESAKPFSLAVSEIVRLFIEECLPVRAAHRTTNEFLHDLVTLPDSPLATHRETLGEFLHHCDLAKFARWSLTVPQMEAMLDSASAFVIAIGKPQTAKKQPAKAAPASGGELLSAHS